MRRIHTAIEKKLSNDEFQMTTTHTSELFLSPKGEKPFCEMKL